jgi:mannose-6-phosphate isomerase-like protein (cupin superfamily)
MTEKTEKTEEKYSELFEQRSWGYFSIIEERKGYKVKSVNVSSGKRSSYKKHARRSENWVVVRGIGLVTLDERKIILKAGNSVEIPPGAAQRIENPGIETLILIEIQIGDYLGEDDIERLEDDFGRV